MISLGLDSPKTRNNVIDRKVKSSDVYSLALVYFVSEYYSSFLGAITHIFPKWMYIVINL